VRWVRRPLLASETSGKQADAGLPPCHNPPMPRPTSSTSQEAGAVVVKAQNRLIGRDKNKVAKKRKTGLSHISCRNVARRRHAEVLVSPHGRWAIAHSAATPRHQAHNKCIVTALTYPTRSTAVGADRLFRSRSDPSQTPFDTWCRCSRRMITQARTRLRTRSGTTDTTDGLERSEGF
jgi:hypothetical protein